MCGRDREIGAYCRDNAGVADIMQNGFERVAGRVNGVGPCRTRLAKGMRAKGRQIGAHEGRPDRVPEGICGFVGAAFQAHHFENSASDPYFRGRKQRVVGAEKLHQFQVLDPPF
jgi:hypothetical protein